VLPSLVPVVLVVLVLVVLVLVVLVLVVLVLVPAVLVRLVAPAAVPAGAGACVPLRLPRLVRPRRPAARVLGAARRIRLTALTLKRSIRSGTGAPAATPTRCRPGA
jgi:hypothetical protein